MSSFEKFLEVIKYFYNHNKVLNHNNLLETQGITLKISLVLFGIMRYYAHMETLLEYS